jgi:hypothetical protein
MSFSQGRNVVQYRRRCCVRVLPKWIIFPAIIPHPLAVGTVVPYPEGGGDGQVVSALRPSVQARFWGLHHSSPACHGV